MPTQLVTNPPWCTGRRYCNAAPPSKFWCYRRPPPHFWRVSFDGFTGIWDWMNDDFIFRYYAYTTGRFPQAIWRSMMTEHPPENFQLFWGQQPTLGTGHQYWWVVQTIWPTISQRVSFASGPHAPVTDWYVFDDFAFSEFERGPLFDGGDDLHVRLKIGEYDEIPAHSCRGDYHGDWDNPALHPPGE